MNTEPHVQSSPSRTGRHVLGLPVLAIVGLSLLALPRVVLHDLRVVHEGTFVNLVLVVVPLVVWVAVALRARVPNPFVTMLATGASYGVLLAAVHQLFWDRTFGPDGPALGGNLAGVDQGAQEVVLRAFASVSSVFTGVAVGAVCGLVAWGIARTTGRGAAGGGQSK